MAAVLMDFSVAKHIRHSQISLTSLMHLALSEVKLSPSEKWS